ncbi:hypothetical protein CIG75_12965 [Tumebacillus algifaecis]|uniref:HTH cro/C1-type domain-containing protein n=1 Tax=Tumebacillus algifaecis TaxID=1214604 RepID=A0A223D2J8_9BACL|nr:helix-turn-helix transcriptional regulator [Tumebacillus algifaecis]ASS75810.1 hypothetical protein CIG75_12965 [Tumebacillus algifaecis]
MKRKKLTELRQDRNWKQEDVVYRLKEFYEISISASYYGMIEQGVRTPNLQLGIAIAELFETEIKDLFFCSSTQQIVG